MRDITPLFARFGESDFVVLGRPIGDGYWYGGVADMCRLADSDCLPKFNGGILYFARSTKTAEIFAQARHLAERYAGLGYATFNGGIADEPLLAISLAQHGVQALPVENSSVSLLGITSPLRINVVDGRASFDKGHRPMRPAIVHFAADFSSRFRLAGFYYRRECLRLRLTDRGVSTFLAGIAVQTAYGLPCALFGGWKLLRRATSGRAP